MLTLVLKKILDLGDLPSDWSVVRLAADWHGQPLVLIAEGKPEKPKPPYEAESWGEWLRGRPRAHHLLHIEGRAFKQLSFEGSSGPSTFHVQPVEGGWLLGERRGIFGLYDYAGIRRKSLELGDASEDVQTTPDGRIWVSYFDEGVFGGGIGKNGVVCFDPHGTPVFRYAEFAEQNDLPFVADCYAMNVEPSGDVWLDYYTDFPLVHLRREAIEHVWPGFGPVGNAFAVRDGVIIYPTASKLMARSLQTPHEAEAVELRDENGGTLVPVEPAHLGMVGRGRAVLVTTEAAIYGLD